MANFPYYYAIIGGSLIGISASLMMGFFGHICGVSGILFKLTGNSTSTYKNPVIFILGIVLGSYLATFHILNITTMTIHGSYPEIILAGLSVGAGVKLGNGCTSGHGICGVARLSPRSLVATSIFIFFGIMTVYIRRHF